MNKMKKLKPDADGFLYGLEDKVPAGQSTVYGLQYLVYFLAGSAIMPVIIGTYLGLDQVHIAQMLQRTFLLSGGVSILQAIFGHRFPIIDGPAGLWMGLLIILSSASTSFGKGLNVLRADLEFGMICAGIMVVIIGLTGLMDKILKIFNPIINGSFLILMVLQMSATVMKGATGISSGNITIQPKYLFIFFVTTAIIVVINLKAKGFFQSIATLIGVVCGWILAYLLGISPDFISSHDGLIAVPQAFAWGKPTIDSSVIITCLIGEFVLFSNFAASIHGMEEMLHKPADHKTIRNSTLLFGLTAALTGIFPVPGFVPFASAPSTTKLTRVAARGPFIIGGIFMMVLGIIAPICSFFAAIPPSVGYSAMMIVFAMMMIQGLNEFKKIDFSTREGFIVGISFMVGAGIMFLDSTSFSSMPQMLRYIASNGLIVGLILVILLDQVILRKPNPKRIKD
ncbi:purine/pyrimidine permease [Eubacterium oxidoreducens]|uniref:Xanthine/uracil permease n=1 Tax=Eubacterium oxidoreducens TaxID=1732 RepID=A0A1G6ACU5_EUBOX|nr:purine/pyrimidine permease [Eubacterium oxidoreducens]SDB06136.1 Xanthine/uracil permease [Eubacterium oxidoreducens]